jgi:hypothetical protein
MLTLPQLPLGSALVYRTDPKTIQLWYDTDKERIVIDLRWLRRSLVKVDITTLVDFDPDKKRWCTELAKRYDELEGWRQCDKLYTETLAMVEATLEKDEQNSNWKRAWYYLKGSIK